MRDEDSEQRKLDGGPLLLIFLILMVALVLGALLQFTGGFDLSVFL